MLLDQFVLGRNAPSAIASFSRISLRARECGDDFVVVCRVFIRQRAAFTIIKSLFVPCDKTLPFDIYLMPNLAIRSIFHLLRNGSCGRFAKRLAVKKHLSNLRFTVFGD